MTDGRGGQLRIVLLTSGGLNGAVVMDRILTTSKVSLVGVAQSTRVLRARQGSFTGARQLIRQCGWRYASYLWTSTWFADVALDFASKRGVRGQCERQRIPMLKTRQINSPEGLHWLATLAPDLVVSAFFNQRISAQVIGLARMGAVNIHPGALPALRGVDPVFFARLRGMEPGETSLHRITDEFDCGPVLATDVAVAPDGASVLQVTADCYRRGVELLMNSIDGICADASGVPQSGAENYDSWPTKRQVMDFHASGCRLITADEITGLLRGRFPGASA